MREQQSKNQTELPYTIERLAEKGCDLTSDYECGSEWNYAWFLFWLILHYTDGLCTGELRESRKLSATFYNAHTFTWKMTWKRSCMSSKFLSLLYTVSRLFVNLQSTALLMLANNWRCPWFEHATENWPSIETKTIIASHRSKLIPKTSFSSPKFYCKWFSVTTIALLL